MDKQQQAERFKRGPYVNEYGLIVVPLPPDHGPRNWAYWEPLGFHPNGDGAVVRSIHVPYRGKTYNAKAWLTSTRRKFAEQWVGWVDRRPHDWRIERPCTDPHRTAAHLYRQYNNGHWGDFEAHGRGYKSYEYAGAIKNKYGITDRRVRRALQEIAQAAFDRYDAMTEDEYREAHHQRNPILAQVAAQVQGA